MDWMYDGRQVQKEDYLLGKKVDKNFGETTDNNDSILPPQICPSDSKFSQVDMTKKILEDPLVNIKKREIECTQKILQNPMRLKKQQNVQPEKHTIEDHQLDMILVSRLKSYEKAGLDLAKILSITKNKSKKEHKKKLKKSKSSSENDEDTYKITYKYGKSTNKQKNYDQKSNDFEQKDKNYNDKKSFEYRDHRRIGNKNRNERYRPHSSLDDVNFNKSANESNKHKYKDNNKRYDSRRSLSKEKHQRNEIENKHWKKLHSDGKRHRSVSLNKEFEQKKKSDVKSENITSKHSKSKSNNYHNSNVSDREQQSQVTKDTKSMHKHGTNVDEKRSRSGSQTKEKQYENKNKIKKREKNIQNSSSPVNERKNLNIMKITSKRQHSPEVHSGIEEHNIMPCEKDNFKNKQSFGLFVPKGQSVKTSLNSPQLVKTKKIANDVLPNTPVVKKKKMTEKEMERMRKEMMDNAKIRDKERSSNVKRYRKENKKEEETLKPYSKEFMIKQLAHAASQISVERSIKSNVNKLQKNNTLTD